MVRDTKGKRKKERAVAPVSTLAIDRVSLLPEISPTGGHGRITARRGGPSAAARSIDRSAALREQEAPRGFLFGRYYGSTTEKVMRAGVRIQQGKQADGTDGSGAETEPSPRDGSHGSLESKKKRQVSRNRAKPVQKITGAAAGKDSDKNPTTDAGDPSPPSPLPRFKEGEEGKEKEEAANTDAERTAEATSAAAKTEDDDDDDVSALVSKRETTPTAKEDSKGNEATDPGPSDDGGEDETTDAAADSPTRNGDTDGVAAGSSPGGTAKGRTSRKPSVDRKWIGEASVVYAPVTGSAEQLSSIPESGGVNQPTATAGSDSNDTKSTAATDGDAPASRASSHRHPLSPHRLSGSGRRHSHVPNNNRVRHLRHLSENDVGPAGRRRGTIDNGSGVGSGAPGSPSYEGGGGGRTRSDSVSSTTSLRNPIFESPNGSPGPKMPLRPRRLTLASLSRRDPTIESVQSLPPPLDADAQTEAEGETMATLKAKLDMLCAIDEIRDDFEEDPQGMLQAIVSHLEGSIPANVVLLYTQDRKRGGLRLSASNTDLPQYPTAAEIAEAFPRGAPKDRPAVTDTRRLASLRQHGEDAQRLMICNINLNDAPLGVLVLSRHGGAAPFSYRDSRAVATALTQIDSAIVQGFARFDLTVQNKVLEVIHALHAARSRCQSSPELYTDAALGILLDHCDAHFVFLLTVHPARREFEMEAWVNREDKGKKRDNNNSNPNNFSSNNSTDSTVSLRAAIVSGGGQVMAQVPFSPPAEWMEHIFRIATRARNDPGELTTDVDRIGILSMPDPTDAPGAKGADGGDAVGAPRTSVNFTMCAALTMVPDDEPGAADEEASDSDGEQDLEKADANGGGDPNGGDGANGGADNSNATPTTASDAVERRKAMQKDLRKSIRVASAADNNVVGCIGVVRRGRTMGDGFTDFDHEWFSKLIDELEPSMFIARDLKERQLEILLTMDDIRDENKETPHQMIEEIVEFCLEAFSADAVLLYTVEKAVTKGRDEELQDDDADSADGDLVLNGSAYSPIMTGASWPSIEDVETVLCDMTEDFAMFSHTRRDQRIFPGLRLSKRGAVMIGVMHFDGKPLGAMVVARSLSSFSRDDLDLLKTAVTQIDSAIVQAKSQVELAVRNLELEAVYRLDEIRDRGLPRDQLLFAVCAEIEVAIKCDVAFALVYKFESGSLEIKHATPDDKWDPTLGPDVIRVLGTAVDSKALVTWSRSAKAQGLPQPQLPSPSSISDRIAAAIGAPLVIHGRVIAVFGGVRFARPRVPAHALLAYGSSPSAAGGDAAAAAGKDGSAGSGGISFSLPVVTEGVASALEPPRKTARARPRRGTMFATQRPNVNINASFSSSSSSSSSANNVSLTTPPVSGSAATAAAPAVTATSTGAIGGPGVGAGEARDVSRSGSEPPLSPAPFSTIPTTGTPQGSAALLAGRERMRVRRASVSAMQFRPASMIAGGVSPSGSAHGSPLGPSGGGGGLDIPSPAGGGFTRGASPLAGSTTAAGSPLQQQQQQQQQPQTDSGGSAEPKGRPAALSEASSAVSEGNTALAVAVDEDFSDIDGRLLQAILSQMDAEMFENFETWQLRKILARSLDPRVLEYMMQSGTIGMIPPEKRVLSVLFCDLRGSTKLAEETDPMVLVEFLNDYLQRAAQVVMDHGGQIDKFVGDEVVAVFGAPYPQEDHALRAVRAGREIVDVHEETIKQWRARGISAPVGVGIATGPIFVGEIGCALRTDYTVIGKVANRGARLCSAAAGGQVLISEATYDMTKGSITAEPVAGLEMKGLTSDFAAFSVTAVSAYDRKLLNSEDRSEIRADMPGMAQTPKLKSTSAGSSLRDPPRPASVAGIATQSSGSAPSASGLGASGGLPSSGLSSPRLGGNNTNSIGSGSKDASSNGIGGGGPAAFRAARHSTSDATVSPRPLVSTTTTGGGGGGAHGPTSPTGSRLGPTSPNGSRASQPGSSYAQQRGHHHTGSSGHITHVTSTTTTSSSSVSMPMSSSSSLTLAPHGVAGVPSRDASGMIAAMVCDSDSDAGGGGSTPRKNPRPPQSGGPGAQVRGQRFAGGALPLRAEIADVFDTSMEIGAETDEPEVARRVGTDV